MLGFTTKHEALNCPALDERWCGSLRTGYDAIAVFVRDQVSQRGSDRTVRIALDGHLGVAWESLVARIIARLSELGISCAFRADVRACGKSPAEVDELIRGSLAAGAPWGRVYDGPLSAFFDAGRLSALQERLREAGGRQAGTAAGTTPAVAIVYGTGAALRELVGEVDIVAWIDLTKKELLCRFDRREVLLLGAEQPEESEKRIVRRLSYVELPVLHPHKQDVLARMDWYLQADRTDCPVLVPSDAYRAILGALAVQPMRPLPYYFPRIWGGVHMVKLRCLPMKRCSFCIEVAPRNQSVRILVGDTILEVPFLNVLWNSPRDILGESTLERFGVYFPLTLNYDDNYRGGSLALQNHPGRTYMKERFNEFDTHDEMYYVVRAWKGAKTYHGLRDGVDLAELRSLAERAEREGVPFDYEKYVNSWDYPGTVHDLYLHPAGTLHSSGANQLVLEIDFDGSREGQEYTFHLYDFLRKDLDGTLRGIHLDHFFRELRPERTRSWIPGKLKQEPRLLRTEGRSGRELMIGDWHEMYYTVRRLEFRTRMSDDTAGKFHILSLVAGDRVTVRSTARPERSHEIRYTESVILPAAFGAYEIINGGRGSCKVTKVLMR
jgi:mannose-6-phosphate isomerase